METTEQLSEPSYRVGMKQTSKGDWYAEFTVRAETRDDLITKFNDAKTFVLEQLKELNGGEK